MTWLAVRTHDGAHVIPVADAITHEESADCVCGPRFEMVECTAGGTAWLTTHHSLDGRELTE